MPNLVGIVLLPVWPSCAYVSEEGGEPTVSQLTVLIYTDNPEFAHTIAARWQTERTVPSFLVSGSKTWETDKEVHYDLAIVGSAGEDPSAVLKRIEYQSRPTIFFSNRSVDAQAVRASHPRVLVLQEYEGWVNAAVLLAGEALRRVDAVNRARKAEQSVTSAQRHAMLGRYMLDMRHNLNNALTSILGNSELLLLEPGSFSADVREQIQTIHSMTMRMHEIIQRFTSLETEMQFADRQSHGETNAAVHSYVSGD
jgi:signal transduction histidine kinase